MMVIQWFVLPINPEPWKVGPVGINSRGSKVRGYIGPDPQLVNYQKAIKAHFTKQYPQRQVVDSECALTFFFWRRLDTYVTPSDRAHMRHVADATNMQKALEDALQGVVITNDRLVKRITSEVVEQSADTEPAIVVAIASGSLDYLWESTSWGVTVPQVVRDELGAVRAASVLDLGNRL